MTPENSSDGNRHLISNPSESEILRENHYETPETIIRLLKGALDPIIVDPIPSNITLSDIVISRDSQGGLTITCNVSYEIEEQG